MTALKIVHFSDVLCVWAYVGQSSLMQLAETFGDQIEVETRFCSVFPDALGKLEKAWHDRGGLYGYADHVRQVAAGFSGSDVHPDTWSKTRPKSSASPHLFIKALELVAHQNPDSNLLDCIAFRASAALRAAFFVQANDISDWQIQSSVCQELGFDFDRVRRTIETGEAIARLAADYEDSQALSVRGSPTYILNDGRQMLFGNISYNVLEANVTGLLSEQQEITGSAC